MHLGFGDGVMSQYVGLVIGWTYSMITRRVGEVPSCRLLTIAVRLWSVASSQQLLPLSSHTSTRCLY